MAHPEKLVDLILAQYSDRWTRDQLLFEARQMTALMRPELIEIGYMNPGRWGHIKETYVEMGMLDPNFSLAGFLYDANPRLDLAWTYRALAAALLVSLVTAGIATHYRGLTRALKTSEERHRLLADNAADVIWTMDLKGRFTYVSPSVTKLRGYSPDEVMLQTLAEALTPESARVAQAGLGGVVEAIQQGLPVPGFRGELEQPCKDGSTVWTEVTTTGMTNEEGNFIGILGVTRDITNLKALAAEKAALDHQNRHLERAESLGRMAGSIAHHFNNKLQAVITNLDLLSALPKGADPTKYVAMAKLAAEKAAVVSRQMLVYLGNNPGEQNPLSLGELCAVSLPSLHQALPGEVTLESACPTPGPVIKGNAEHLQQLLTNLVTNAGEAMSLAGGNVRLSLSTCPAAEIPTDYRFPIGWQPMGQDYACLEVADIGVGIPAADIEKLFDPFFSTKFTGRGLGLSVVLGLVQAHGGCLTVASQPGQGSVFRVYFPLSAETTPGLPERAVPVPEQAGGGTFLLVDDDEMLLESACELLDLLGFNVLTAKDGIEALEVFRQHQAEIRCVLTDLTMPRMDGWGLLTELRILNPNLPVILASGYDKAQVLAGTRSNHPEAFLSKPFSLQQLHDAVGQALVASRNSRL